MKHINAGISIDISLHMYKKQLTVGLKMAVQIVLSLARPDGLMYLLNGNDLCPSVEAGQTVLVF